ncbi:MAG: aromatic ring-hydroxylating dioxygenase subunit alpha [Gammaproteobacteria bacterium]|nr:aromatic ring-hydroxylating dioxygenase subunit alpha [Gammaproteobacteria bacterium]
MQFTTAAALYEKAGGKRNGLPAWTYNNAELTELETEQVFLRNWIWVGHISDIPEAGDFQCIDLANERAIVIRGEAGEVRAFHNLCRHRGSRVVSQNKGHCDKAIVCPFHGWSYHFDGALKNIPRARSFPEIDKAKYGLKALDCEVWLGLIFVRFCGEGASIAESFAEAEEEISLYNIASMKTYDEPWRFDFDLDWKSVIDIDNEGYHVPVGHPQLFDLTGSSYKDQVLESGISRSYGSFENRRAKTPLIQNYISALPESNYLPESHRHLWIYWGLFPGIVITLFPDMIEVYQVYPTGYHKSVMAGACYALPDARAEMESARQYNREINMGVGEEDVQLVKWAAEGQRSSAFDQVLLSDLELGVCAFQNRLRELIPVVALDTAPETGSLKSANQKMIKKRHLTSAA